MSVQPTHDKSVPSHVTAEVLGRTVVGKVVSTVCKANAGTGIHDELVIDVGGRKFRVDASDAEAYPPTGGR